ncbi:MAG: lysoplasmalogenase [Bacteroidota bacterium]
MRSLSTASKLLLLIFVLAAVVNLVANQTGATALVIISKPLLMTSLVGFFWRERKGVGCEIWLLIGLVFSFLGDCFLLGNSQLFFLFGLGSFLVTQFFYTIAFRRQIRQHSALSIAPLLLSVLPFLIYYVGVLSLLWATLPSDFRLPIVIYSTVITAMAIAGTYLAIQTKNWLLIVGAILFVISDSCIAIDKFTEIKLPVVRLLIMGTYIGAQLAIVWSQVRIAPLELTATRTRV